jgi:hypothetical protein
VYEVKLHNKRVFAVRLGVIEHMDEVRALWEAMRAELMTTKGLVVAAADWRLGAIYRPEITEGMLGILKADNPRLELSAHVLGSSALLNLQIERLVREAGKSSRRIFRTAGEAHAFLSTALTAPEAAWLKQWYDAIPSATTPRS